MAFKYKSYAVCLLGKYLQNPSAVILGPINYANDTLQPSRHYKHYNPKYKKFRKEKFIKVELPEYDEDGKYIESEKKRSFLKDNGIFPTKPWSERPFFISATPTVFEPYIAPEGDGRYSTITKEGAKQKLTEIKMKGKSTMAARKIRGFDDRFRTSSFGEEALDIYIKAHEALAAKDTDNLTKYVTETAYPQMMHNITNKTIKWNFLESLEPSRVVHVRCTEIISKDNIFGQVTVRFHTQQMLSVYDRFGRMMQGNAILKKDVLEYVVFEKHLSNEYGIWRLHSKIIPSWMPEKETGEKTYVLPEEEEHTDEQEPISVLKDALTENEKKMISQ